MAFFKPTREGGYINPTYNKLNTVMAVTTIVIFIAFIVVLLVV